MINYHQLIEEADKNIYDVVIKTPLELSQFLSDKYKANILLKREDKQVVRSFKIRGAYNKIKLLSKKERFHGVVCASSGNHAQGVALSCSKLKINGTVFMPKVTPNQKINKVKDFGGKYVQIILKGTTYDEACHEATSYCNRTKGILVHPFNDPYVIAGQGTIGKEILNQHPEKIDYLLASIGGGGLISGVSSYLKEASPNTIIYGIEPKGAASMTIAMKEKKPVTLDTIDTFVEGTAVKTVGTETLKICLKNLKKTIVIPEGDVCTAMVDLYQNDGIVTEPAGALPISALENIKDQIKGKTVICIISGGNNDILRYPEIIERSMHYRGLRYYFILYFPQKPGQLRHFLLKVLSPEDDIIRFEYIKKTNAEKGPALVGVEVPQRDNFEKIKKNMQEAGFNYELINDNQFLFKYIVS